MVNNILIQKGQIRNFFGKKTTGKINFSNLTGYESLSISEDYSIKHVIEGTEEYLIDGKTHRVNSGQFLLVKPLQEVQVKLESKSVVKGNCIYISPKKFEKKLSNKNNSDFIFPSFVIDTKGNNFELFFNRLNSIEKTINCDYLLEKSIQNLHLFLEDSNTKLKSLDVKKSDTKLFLWQSIELGRSYIHKNIHRKIKLADIANEARMSPFHFQRNFKSFYNISPSDCIFNIKMKKAKQLLQNKNISKRDAMYHVGFEDVKYFKRCLRKSSS